MKALIALACVLLVSCASAQQLLTKMEFELDDLTGISQLNNTNGTAVVVTIHNATDGSLVVQRYAAAGIYLPNMTIVMQGNKFNLSYNTLYTYNLSTVYGDFLYNFTTPVYRVDTSSANATASKILSGYTGYVNGNKLTGIIADCAAEGTGLCYVAQATMALLDLDLATGNIKNGTTIFGISGNSKVLDTSSGTAATGDVLSGKVAFSNGSAITGSIATQTLSAASVSVPAGYYAVANLSVVNSNLTATNIKSGVNIFGIAGAAPAGALLRTGQTLCYNATGVKTCPVTGFPRQDADISGATAKSFHNNSDWTVTDQQTGIMWTRNDSVSTKTWANALIYCNGSTTGGYTDWHLPNFVEVATLIDFGCSAAGGSCYGAYKNVAFKWSSDYYWTSTSLPSAPSDAYDAHFGYGRIGIDGKGYAADFVARCARSA